MRILIVTPAPAGSRKGNRITAMRWARLLSPPHRVEIGQQYTGQSCDVLVALHARKSAEAVARFRQDCPHKRLIVAISGTDLYFDLPRGSKAARRSLTLADRLIVLQPRAVDDLEAELRRKCRVIYQSATPRPRPPALKSVFEVAVVGHLRAVKDPFRTALAARRLPADIRVRITHVGAALTETMRRRAVREVERNPRYHWLGEVSHARTRYLVARSRLAINSSKLEGGANAVGEAVVCGVPVLASRVPGNVGLLGDDYRGYFPVGDTAALARQIERAVREPRFLQTLERQVARRARWFTPEAERRAWQRLLQE